jgi:peptidase E
MRLLLTSFTTSEEHDAVLAGLIGKAPSETRVAYIENAHDVYDDEESLDHGRQDLKSKGYDVELVDLRQWRADRAGLREKLAGKDLFALAGANPFYLRWLMKVTGADEIITDLVRQGTVYGGASAAAVVAGPTLRYFDNQDDPNAAEEVIWDGLNLTQTVVVPTSTMSSSARAAGRPASS